MGVIKHLKTLFPLPKKWEKDPDERAFGLRLEEAYRWIQTEKDSEAKSRARFIHLVTSDNTWVKVWEKISKLKDGETAIFTCEGDTYGILSGGVRSTKVYGTISRRNSGQYNIIWRGNNNVLGVGYITGASSSSAGTYAERVITLELDELDERVVGKRTTKSITGSSSSQSVRVDFPSSCCCFLILSLPGISNTWVGCVYTASNGNTTVNQINSSAGISVTGNSSGGNRVTVSFTYSSSTTLHMTAIPFRGTVLPSFH